MRDVKHTALPVMLNLRGREAVKIRCLRCRVHGTYRGTAAFLISCVCGGRVVLTRPAGRKGT